MKKFYHLTFTIDPVDPVPVPEPGFHNAYQLAIALTLKLQHCYGYEAIRVIEPSKRKKGGRCEKTSV